MNKAMKAIIFIALFINFNTGLGLVKSIPDSEYTGLTETKQMELNYPSPTKRYYDYQTPNGLISFQISTWDKKTVKGEEEYLVKIVARIFDKDKKNLFEEKEARFLTGVGKKIRLFNLLYFSIKEKTIITTPYGNVDKLVLEASVSSEKDELFQSGKMFLMQTPPALEAGNYFAHALEDIYSFEVVSIEKNKVAIAYNGTSAKQLTCNGKKSIELREGEFGRCGEYPLCFAVKQIKNNAVSTKPQKEKDKGRLTAEVITGNTGEACEQPGFTEVFSYKSGDYLTIQKISHTKGRKYAVTLEQEKKRIDIEIADSNKDGITLQVHQNGELVCNPYTPECTIKNNENSPVFIAEKTGVQITGLKKYSGEDEYVINADYDSYKFDYEKQECNAIQYSGDSKGKLNLLVIQGDTTETCSLNEGEECDWLLAEVEKAFDNLYSIPGN